MTQIPATMQVLEQKSWFRKARYELREHGMYVFEKTLKTTFEEEIRYEDFSSRISRWERRQPVLAILTIAMAVLGMAGVVLQGVEWLAFCLAAVLVLVFVIHFRRKNLVRIHLQSGLAVGIDADIPDEPAVDRFVNNFKDVKRDYLVAKYGSVDRDLPIEPQLNQLVWLRNEEYIDEQTLQELKNKLLGKQQESRIGFHRKED
jgi:hypothetical protein